MAVGVREKLSVFGGDWDTPDGTCTRLVRPTRIEDS